MTELTKHGVDYSMCECKRDYTVGLLLAFATFLLGAGDDTFEHIYDPGDDDLGLIGRKSREQQQQQQPEDGARMHLVHSVGLGRLGLAVLAQDSNAVDDAIQRAYIMRAAARSVL